MRRIAGAILVMIVALTCRFGTASATMPPLRGDVPDALGEALARGAFGVPVRPTGLHTSSTRSTFKIPVVLVGYSDAALKFGPTEFQATLFDTAGHFPSGSISDYYRWVSGNRMRVSFKIVGNVRVPQSREFYGGGTWGLNTGITPQNTAGLVVDALRACSNDVDWSEFDSDYDGYVDMLWVVHAGIGGEASQDRSYPWSFTSSLSFGWRATDAFVTRDSVPGSSSQLIRVDRFSILPELSSFRAGAMSEIGVYCHEFGHALGLPDLYDTSASGRNSNVGPGNWSLMSSGAYGTDGISPESPSHLGAWPLQYLDWGHTITPALDTTLVMHPVEQGGDVVNWWFQGESYYESFLLENRQRLGYDRNLPSPGVVMYHVNLAAIGLRIASNTVNAGPEPGLVLVEADGRHDLTNGYNHGDENDPFPGRSGRTFIDDDTQPNTRTFNGLATNLALLDAAPSGAGLDMRLSLRLRATGWLPPEDYTRGTYLPLATNSAARTAVVDKQGIASIVRSEVVAGRPQVVLRSSPGWSESIVLSHSTGAAIDPAIALLPGGDLAVVWSDTREGRAKVFYRSRIRGAWTAERRLVDTRTGECRSPAIGADARGTLSLAFRFVENGAARIRFARFSYFTPLAQPVDLTGARERPESPAVAVSPDGLAYVIWGDAIEPPQSLWYSIVRPDASVSRPSRLTPATSKAQTGFSALFDSAGTFHLAWVTSGPGSADLRYQRRLPSGAIWDPVIESQGTAIQTPVLTIDGQGSLHLVWESARAGAKQARYRRWLASTGWDGFSTEVTLGAWGDISSPIVLPTRDGNVSIVYVGTLGAEQRLMVRRRELVPSSLLAAPSPAPAAVEHRVALGPNPLRGGAPLRLTWSGEAPANPVVDVFDLSGRRIASIPLAGSGTHWEARVPAGARDRWDPGVYFARVRGAASLPARLVVIR